MKNLQVLNFQNQEEKQMKKLILVIFIISTLVIGTMPAFGNSADDYKVIKKASKSKKNSGDITWFRLEIIEKTGQKSKVKIKLPISIVETLADCTEGKVNLEDNCKVDLKRVLADLKKHGPMTLVEIESDDANIRIWFE
jgi:hypothetical protein